MRYPVEDLVEMVAENIWDCSEEMHNGKYTWQRQKEIGRDFDTRIVYKHARKIVELFIDRGV